MRGVEIAAFGGPSALSFRDDLNPPTPGDHDLLVRNEFAGVNFKDLLLCRGAYHGGNPTLPFIPGIEAAGVITAVGKKVERFEVGQRVAYMTGSMDSKHNQCYAEFNRIPETGCIHEVPATLSLETACALVIQGLTMHYLTSDCFTPRRGDVVLVHGGGGGLGLLMISRMKALGAVVIATASHEAKRAAARANGADHVIDYTSEDFEAAVRTRFPSGIRCVFDGIGKRTFLKGLSCLQRRGTMVLYGNAGGEHPDPIAPTRLAQLGSLVLMRPSLYDFVATPDELRTRLDEVFAWYQAGTINLNHLTRVPLAEVGALHEAMVGRQVVGKAVLEI